MDNESRKVETLRKKQKEMLQIKTERQREERMKKWDRISKKKRDNYKKV